jgi:hypothetical protein
MNPATAKKKRGATHALLILSHSPSSLNKLILMKRGK